ncbi:DUF4360 domain-containing protein [Actinomadura decatromicini]|uniref:DUF4360 domain-containing protein n=1 Tax=Actinomadura decatromicini TaxID=2604572 RepID=A0A5D3F8B9_9ACTN|nr:DUF4360 domain-containing protein [Actinomadura decatromicini]TYK44066.1 DUF4360 domain-containing protein [Actinomadura decatromicini]
MHKEIALSAAATAAALALAATPAAASAPVNSGAVFPPDMGVEIVAWNGSGCPQGTAAGQLSDGREAFTITYAEYKVRTGGDAKPTDMRKNCQLGLKVYVPQGFTYAITQVDYRGSAHLEKGASLVNKRGFYFEGSSGGGTLSNSLVGEFDDNWQYTDVIPVDQRVWRKCGEQPNLNISTELRAVKGISDASKVSWGAMDSLDGSIRQTYHLAWKACS